MPFSNTYDLWLPARQAVAKTGETNIVVSIQGFHCRIAQVHDIGTRQWPDHLPAPIGIRSNHGVLTSGLFGFVFVQR